VNIPVVKEHGSWVVFALSSIVAVIAAMDVSMGEIPYLRLVPVISGIALLINSKKPLTSAIRAGRQRASSIYWFFFFSMCGLLMVFPFMIKGIVSFSVFLPLIILYALLLFSGREHSLIAELTGFALLCVTAPVVYFILTGELSLRLYLIVLLFFSAGVFKVRLRLRKGVKEKAMMILYCIGVFIVFRYLGVPTIILLPLLENLLTALWIREEKLSTTGQIELLKGVAFVFLFAITL
jgi:hypothetical protein